jgi:circadian clock protein KaiB
VAAAPTTVTTPPSGFKGIALFTPGGDLVYCRDEHKRAQWHVNLCAVLQEVLTLTAPPHFLVPTYSATVDCWLDAKTHRLQMVAEAAPTVLRYQALLNQIFNLWDVEWQPLYPQAETHSLAIMATYREEFPALWMEHDLVLDISQHRAGGLGHQDVALSTSGNHAPMLRLFVSGHSALTEHILMTLQEVLETSRYRPYSLKVIDVSKHPEQAEADQISATPTLVRVEPGPIKRLVGDLDDPQAILKLLADH